MAKSCLSVFAFPEASFFRLWNIKRRRRNRQPKLAVPDPDVAPTTEVLPDPVRSGVRGRPRRKCRGRLPAVLEVPDVPPVVNPDPEVGVTRHRPRRRCRDHQPAALGAAPEAPFVPFVPIVPAMTDPVPPNMDIDPFKGPLNLGIDNDSGDFPPPASPAGLIPAPVEPALQTTATNPTPLISDDNPGFGVAGYPSSNESGGEQATLSPLRALGLQPTATTSGTLELGIEQNQFVDSPFQLFTMHPNVTLIMPTERAELVEINCRQFYRIPATHCATGAPVYLSTPVEMGPPSVIFRQFRQFMPLSPPRLPHDCVGLVPNIGHKVNMVVRSYSFP